MKIIKLDPSQQENYCSNKEHCNRRATFKIIGYSNYYFYTNEIFICHECVLNIYFELRDIIWGNNGDAIELFVSYWIDKELKQGQSRYFYEDGQEKVDR